MLIKKVCCVGCLLLLKSAEMKSLFLVGLPPKANAKAQRERSNIMPTSRWNVKHLA